MQSSFPGFLYAKSLSLGDAPAEGYRTWFLNPALKPHEGRLTSLRDSFRWRTDSSRRHPPVMVIDPVPDAKNVIVVRFSDAGKDTFGRPQTLRMEAMLVPASIAGALWDGTFPAKPDSARAEFIIEAGSTAPSFPGLAGNRLVNGDSANFSLAGYANSAGFQPRVASEPPQRVPSTPSEPSSEFPQSQSRRSLMRTLFIVTLLALIASIALNMWQFGKSADIQDCLSQAEEKNNALRTQMEELKAEHASIEAFRRQSDALDNAIKDLQSGLGHLNDIRTAMDSATANSTSDN